jgi:hypothetical protein
MSGSVIQKLAFVKRGLDRGMFIPWRRPFFERMRKEVRCSLMRSMFLSTSSNGHLFFPTGDYGEDGEH